VLKIQIFHCFSVPISTMPVNAAPTPKISAEKATRMIAVVFGRDQ
jgi:hypothetical protein